MVLLTFRQWAPSALGGVTGPGYKPIASCLAIWVLYHLGSSTPSKDLFTADGVPLWASCDSILLGKLSILLLPAKMCESALKLWCMWVALALLTHLPLVRFSTFQWGHYQAALPSQWMVTIDQTHQVLPSKVFSKSWWALSPKHVYKNHSDALV